MGGISPPEDKIKDIECEGTECDYEEWVEDKLPKTPPSPFTEELVLYAEEMTHPGVYWSTICTCCRLCTALLLLALFCFCTWNLIVEEETHPVPHLHVVYDIPYYNGTVNHGNLFLKADVMPYTPKITSPVERAHPPHSPWVAFPDAEADKLYTFVMKQIIPVEDAAQTLWKEALPWVHGNIPGSDLHRWMYLGHGPDWDHIFDFHPFKRLHHFEFNLFEQPHGKIDFNPLNFDFRTNPIQDVDRFLGNFGFTTQPQASNWMAVQPTMGMRGFDRFGDRPYKREAPKQTSHCGSQLVVEFAEPGFGQGGTRILPGMHPAMLASLILVGDNSESKLYSRKVECGNVILSKDIADAPNDVAPKVTFPEAVKGSLYTLVMVDPDGLLGGEASWPFDEPCTKPSDGFVCSVYRTFGSAAGVRWVVANIDAATLTGDGDLSTFYQLSSYKPPFVLFGSHTFKFVLHPQPKGKIPQGWRFDSLDQLTHMDYIGAPVADNWFVVHGELAF